MVTVFMTPAKSATLGVIRIKTFWNKDYDVAISVYDVTNEILSRDSNYIVDVWPKFGNSSFHIRNVIMTSIL